MRRLSARQAAITVAKRLWLPRLAARLNRPEAPPELDARERATLRRGLAVAGIQGPIERLALAMAFDAPRKRQGPGRQGAPSRDWLRAAVRALLAAIKKREASEQLPAVAALLVLLHGLDSHSAFWRRGGGAPPLGRDRVRWIAKRVSELASDGAGQYAARKAEADP